MKNMNSPKADSNGCSVMLAKKINLRHESLQVLLLVIDFWGDSVDRYDITLPCVVRY